LHKVFGAFTSQKLLSPKNKNEEWILRKHLSTKERLPYYTEVYKRIFSGFEKNKEISIIDLGAGVNGFSYDYFGSPKIKYFGVEAVGQLVDLMNKYFSYEKIKYTQNKIQDYSVAVPESTNNLMMTGAQKLGDSFMNVSSDPVWPWFMIGGLFFVPIIFVAGGNVFYLLEKAKESGFDKVAVELVEKGVIYVGSSAGAALAGPDIEPIKELDDPLEAQNLKSTRSLNLVDFVVIPHYRSERFNEGVEKILKNSKEYKYKLIPITDQQAVVVKGNKYNIV